MSAPPRDPRQPLVAAWAGQIIGTLVIAFAIYLYFRHAGAPFGAGHEEWARWARHAILLAALPAILYLRTFKARLDADERALRVAGGAPDPGARALLQRSQAVGGALCELPLAMGVLHLVLGGEARWFVGATLITIALRLSYRPFNRR